jgi:Ohr subfamily peroxiredoxin
MQALYSTTAHARGDGRNGQIESDDGILEAPVRMPPELGGPGGATNPEQLFAAGYAACFHSALRLAGQQAGVDVSGSEVSATVHLGTTDAGGFGLGVDLDVSLPACTPEEARATADRAHELCPYSNATRGNIDVTVSVV